MQRRLSERGLSYSDLLGEVRKTLALNPGDYRSSRNVSAGLS
jgi:hypothetical protein